MSQIITATFDNGVLVPDEPLSLPAQARVRLTVESVEESSHSGDSESWQSLEALWDEAPIDTHGVRLTRDQLHERR
jgi:predicted DNA-binding antitoxin AbrB/MazE fold protein